jgi:MFS transporter, SHS family, lactate transporter
VTLVDSLFLLGFNFLSHGSQDLYPTYLKTTKGFSAHSATVATIIGNCGAIAGGTIAGIVSQYIGRRLTIMYVHFLRHIREHMLIVSVSLCVLLVGCFIPLWIIPDSFSGLAAGGTFVSHAVAVPDHSCTSICLAFCIQFGVQGAWGVIPVLLAEISPPAFRATFPGVAYQLGNMVSSASAQIEATGGEHQRTTIIQKGKPTEVPDYATVQGIFIGIIAAYVILLTILGPENHGAHFEKSKAAFEEGGGRDEVHDDSEGFERSSASGSVRIEEEKRDTV